MSNGLANLSEGQKTCLRLVAQGMSSKEIAKQTGLTPQTVDTYLKAAMARMGAANRRDAARMLSEWEHSQNLGSPPPAVAASPQASDDRPRSNEDGALSWLRLPPLGGRENALSPSETVLAILRIAFLAALAFIACVMVIKMSFDALT